MFDISGLKVVGRRISGELIAVYEELDKSALKNEGPFIHRTEEMVLPLRRVTITEYNEALEKIENYIEKNKGRAMTFEDNAKMHIYAGTLARYKFQQKNETFTKAAFLGSVFKPSEKEKLNPVLMAMSTQTK